MFIRISTSEKIFFIKRLSYLINAGIPVLEAMTMIHHQTKKSSMNKLLDTLVTDIANGQSLATSLRHVEESSGLSFGDFAVHVIAAGEVSGILGKNLSYLALELKKQQVLRQKILGAFMYPIIVVCATCGITGFLMLYLFPKITPVFKSLHITLPWSTRFLIWTSDFLKHHALVFILALCILIISITVFVKKNKTAQLFLARAVLHIPIFGPIVMRYTLAQASRTIGLLLQSGITISDALPVTAETTSHPIYKKEFEMLSGVVIRGSKMSAYFKDRKHLFPDMVCHIVEIGERSGSLSSSLIYLSELYENEVDEFTKNIGSVIEPILMIVMGLVVGFIAVSIITPIYSITQNLHP